MFLPHIVPFTYIFSLVVFERIFSHGVKRIHSNSRPCLYILQTKCAVYINYLHKLSRNPHFEHPGLLLGVK